MVGMVSVSTDKSVFQKLLESTRNEMYKICYLVYQDYDGTDLDQEFFLPVNQEINQDCTDNMNMGDS